MNFLIRHIDSLIQIIAGIIIASAISQKLNRDIDSPKRKTMRLGLKLSWALVACGIIQFAFESFPIYSWHTPSTLYNIHAVSSSKIHNSPVITRFIDSFKIHKE